jgi:hypothetical protein
MVLKVPYRPPDAMIYGFGLFCALPFQSAIIFAGFDDSRKFRTSEILAIIIERI